MQNASMLEANCPRNSDFPETFSGSDTRSISKFLRGYLPAPFHFDVQYAKKAATTADNLQIFSVPYQRTSVHIRPRSVDGLALKLAILPSEFCVNPGPRRERPLPVEYLSGSPFPQNPTVFLLKHRCRCRRRIILRACL